MNWYKISLEKNAINQREFYSPYVYTGLSDEVLQDNPKILIKAIDEINKIRDYYLKFLYKKLASEVGHFLTRVYAPSTIYDDGNSIQVSQSEISKERQRINDFIKDVLMPLKRKILDCTSEKCDLNSEDKANIIKCFADFHWSRQYGGDLWAKLAEYIITLSDVGVIQYNTDKRNINKMREAIMIIDTLNSMEHNTAKVLSDLPDQEKKWIFYALEFLKNVSNPVVISDLIGDSKVSEVYRRDVFPLNEERNFSTEDDRIFYEIPFLNKLDKRKIAQNTNNLNILRMFIKAAEGKSGDRSSGWPMLYSCLAKNPNIFKDDLYKELLKSARRHDGDHYSSHAFPRTAGFLLRSPYITEEAKDFINDFYEENF